MTEQTIYEAVMEAAQPTARELEMQAYLERVELDLTEARGEVRRLNGELLTRTSER